MNGHRLHVRKKMKKIEALFIKRILRITWQPFCQFSFGALSLLFLSHTLGYLEFVGVLLDGVAYFGFWRKNVKKEKESTRGHRDRQLVMASRGPVKASF